MLMNRTRSSIVFFIGAQIFLSACALGLPEQIYTSANHLYRNHKVGLFDFAAPPYAGNAGSEASEALYNGLVSNRIFGKVERIEGAAEAGIKGAHVLDIAIQKQYDLIIVGELLYYFDGDNYDSSRVEEQMRIIEVATGKTLWHAKAETKASPRSSIDLFIARIPGRAARPARELLIENGEKFCRMLAAAQLNGPPSPDTCSHGNKNKELTSEARQL